MHHDEPTVGRRTLGRAIDIAGSAEALAAFLGLSLVDLAEWTAGRKPLPTAVFLALVDIVSANRLVANALGSLSRTPSPHWNGPERRRMR
jgi:hypothetical protein